MYYAGRLTLRDTGGSPGIYTGSPDPALFPAHPSGCLLIASAAIAGWTDTDSRSIATMARQAVERKCLFLI